MTGSTARYSRRAALALTGGGLAALLAGCRSTATTRSPVDLLALRRAATGLRDASYRFVIGHGGADWFEPRVQGSYDPALGCAVTIAAFHNQGEPASVRLVARNEGTYLRVTGPPSIGYGTEPLDTTRWYTLDPAIEATYLRRLTEVPGDPSGAQTLIDHIVEPVATMGTPPDQTLPGSDPTPRMSPAAPPARTITGVLDFVGASAAMPVARVVPDFQLADRPPSTVSPQTAPPTTKSPAALAFRIAAQLDADDRLVQVTVWEPSIGYSWSRIVITTYGDVSADLQRPAVTTFLTATPDTMVQVVTGLNS